MNYFRLGVLVVFAAFFSIIGSSSRAAEPGVPILVYHRFDPGKFALTTVTTADFLGQLDWLDQHDYHVIPLQSVAAWLDGRAPQPAARSVVITVDDGHESVYTQLYPIILRRHVKVTLFIYPSAISRASYALTWDQIREMMKSGLVDVQSHTYWHPNFNHERKRLAPDDYRKFVDVQLLRSKQVLEQKLNVRIDQIAWPYGIHNPDLESEAKQAGYVMGYAFAGGFARPGSDQMAVPRIPISGWAHVKGFPALVEQDVARDGGE